MNDPTPAWLAAHRKSRPYGAFDAPRVRHSWTQPNELVHVADTAFNNHNKNTGEHVSPFDTGLVRVGADGLEVRLMQGVDMMFLKQVIAAGTQATIGRPRPEGSGPYSDYKELTNDEWQEMFRGGLQAALESQTLVFEVWGASRVLTHQLVRSRRAGFHQQSQRSTWYGDRPEVRMPETVWRSGPFVREMWTRSYRAAWQAYQVACDAGIPYEDARYILPEGTVNYIQCEYTIREFINVYAYRGCSMFLREMVEVMRAMRSLVVQNCPELEPFIKVSCEKGTDCIGCNGSGWIYSDGVAATAEEARNKTAKELYGVPQRCPLCKGLGSPNRKCTFQGWENVELACSFPWARENNRVFVASPKLRIGAK